ncbi:Uncharacterised protein [Brucella melitensis]|nr:Uncharacterised protein [Brucella melitensis]
MMVTPPMGRPPGLGVLSASTKKHHPAKVRQAGAFGHRRPVLPVEDIFGDIIIRHEKGRLHRKRIARKACHLYRPCRKFACRAGCRVFLLVWHETAIDQHEAPVFQHQRCIDIKNPLHPLGCQEMALA